MIMGISSALGQSYMIERLPFPGSEFFVALFFALRTIASVIFNNIPLLFAMGVAYGMSRKEKGIAVFASVIAYLTLQITMSVYLSLTDTMVTDNPALVGQGMVLGIHTLRIEAMGGLVAGLVAAKVTDRFYRLELPVAFAFFAGKKSVAIISVAAMIPIGLVIPMLWDGFTSVLNSMSSVLMSDNFGAGLYYSWPWNTRTR